MRRKLTILGIITFILCLCTYAYLIESEQQDIAGRLIRLHVVANSDSSEDQAIKLAVRDRILPIISSLTDGCTSQADASIALLNGLPTIRKTAEQTLLENGSTQTVTVSLLQEQFPRRDYDTFSLPAGTYEALRITIGQGDGHNWWCVAFPSLCLPATTEEFIAAAETSGLSSEQTDLLTGEDVTVELKFRFLDWISFLFE